MGMPDRIGIIDLMMGIPSPSAKIDYDFMRPLFRDAESLSSFEFPVEYMFKDVPKLEKQDDYIRFVGRGHGIQAELYQGALQPVGVGLVHLASDGPDVVAHGLAQQHGGMGDLR